MDRYSIGEIVRREIERGAAVAPHVNDPEEIFVMGRVDLFRISEAVERYVLETLEREREDDP
jgi:hypothetical protein